MVAMLLLSHGDHAISHETVVHPHHAFLQLVTKHDQAENRLDDSTAETEVTLAPTAAMNQAVVVTPCQDYLYRPASLEQLCPILVSMLYYKEQRKFHVDGSPVHLKRVSHFFLPEHPQYHTHLLVRRARPAWPRFITNAPVRPPVDGDPDCIEDWSAWCAANFLAYRADTMPSAPYASKVAAWEVAMNVRMTDADTDAAAHQMDLHSGSGELDTRLVRAIPLLDTHLPVSVLCMV